MTSPLSYTITVNPNVYNDDFIDALCRNFSRFCDNGFEQIYDEQTNYIRNNIIAVHNDDKDSRKREANEQNSKDTTGSHK